MAKEFLTQFSDAIGIPRTALTVIFGWTRFFTFIACTILGFCVFVGTWRLEWVNFDTDLAFLKTFQIMFEIGFIIILLSESIIVPDGVVEEYNHMHSVMSLTRVPKNRRIGVFMMFCSTLESTTFNLWVSQTDIDNAFDHNYPELFQDFEKDSITYLLLYTRAFLFITGSITLLVSIAFPDSTVYDDLYWGFNQRWYERSRCELWKKEESYKYSIAFSPSVMHIINFVNGVIMIIVPSVCCAWHAQSASDQFDAMPAFDRWMEFPDALTLLGSTVALSVICIVFMADASLHFLCPWFRPFNEVQNYMVIHLAIIVMHFFLTSTVENRSLMWWNLSLIGVELLAYTAQEVFLGLFFSDLPNSLLFILNPLFELTNPYIVIKFLQSFAVITGVASIVLLFLAWFGPWLTVDIVLTQNSIFEKIQAFGEDVFEFIRDFWSIFETIIEFINKPIGAIADFVDDLFCGDEPAGGGPPLLGAQGIKMNAVLA